MVSGKASVMVALLVVSLAALTLASETRHYAANTGVLGGVGGLHGAGALGGVGHGLNAGLGHDLAAGLGHDLAAGLGLGHSLDSGLGVGPAAPSAFGSGLGVAAGYGPSGKCKKWCKAPTGNYECCDDLKPGQCPPVRPTCPSVRSVLPPTPCTNDAYCLGTDKCCYDTCLEYRTCKPILSYH
ncbi:glycine-rich cell wall structural protein 2-like [Penaeus japonicus]|uniref:glycine-rich cell wall structural protein 2-like n=1 Tax=Penaeus japonicus TaxID=27405 RepID=UPI001C7154C2|nr:glycine-rich cell wall structural protein 2-like [Penaeus japonicus]